MLILIMGCVGLVLNIISVTFLHGMKLLHYPADRAKLKYEPLEHDHGHEGTNELPAAAETDNNIELSTLQDVSAMLSPLQYFKITLTYIRQRIPIKTIVIK
jgi:hypothetical protein